MVVSAILRRALAAGSSGADGAGICGCAGSAGARLQGTDGRRRTSELQFEPFVEGVAVWVHDKNPEQSRTGASLPGSAWHVVVDGDASSGPHDAVAILAGQSEGYSRTVRPIITDCHLIEFGGHGVARGGRDKNSVASMRTEGLAPVEFRREAEAVKPGDR